MDHSLDSPRLLAAIPSLISFFATPVTFFAASTSENVLVEPVFLLV